jgi:lipopolysaccharide biosynthesis glycosyltransferase
MLDTVALTVCSINYLSQAITLGDSLMNSNPQLEFRIYLVDKLKDCEYLLEKVPYTIIEMCVRYNIIELNTSVKPFIFNFIFKNEDRVRNIIYFDPDIMVFESLEDLRTLLLKASIVLTPHILTPSDEHPYGQAEKNYLMAGVFNLGFLAVSRCLETYKFLNWLEKRLIHQGFADASMHLFYDQKWFDFAPVFFDNVYIEKSPGYNMAGWNLHERTIVPLNDNHFLVNDTHPLVFFHFSGVRTQESDISIYTNYTFEQRPDLEYLIGNYKDKLRKNGDNYFKSYTCYYTQFYKGRIVYYPRLHWVTMYRRTRFNLGKLKRGIHKYFS